MKQTKKHLDACIRACKERPLSVAKGSLLAFIGFILSPFSWWNDVLVNVPLAYAFAAIITLAISLLFTVHVPLFVILFIIGYWISNFLGFYLMQISAQELFKKKPQLRHSIYLSIAYTVIIVLFILAAPSIPFINEITIYPPWVQT